MEAQIIQNLYFNSLFYILTTKNQQNSSFICSPEFQFFLGQQLTANLQHCVQNSSTNVLCIWNQSKHIETLEHPLESVLHCNYMEKTNNEVVYIIYILCEQTFIPPWRR